MKFSRSFFYHILTIIIFFNGTLLSQDSSVVTINYVDQVVDDGKSLLLKPLTWELKDIFILAGITGVGFILNEYDEEIRKDAIKNIGLYKEPFYKAAKYYGEPLTGAVIVAGLYSYGELTDNNYFRLLSLDLFEAYLYSGLITSAIKFTTGRYRPYVNKGANSFLPFSIPYNRTAFPSGHTTLAVALSTVLASRVDNYFYKTLIFIPPVFTGISRILQDQHWASDVFVGAAVSYFVSSYIINKHKNNYNKSDKYSIIPGIDMNGRFYITIQF